MEKFLIIGLGNPGEKYQKTRHNIGFRVLDLLLGDFNQTTTSPFVFNKKINGEIAKVTGGEKLYLLKPSSFMNLSGIPVVAAMNYFEIDVENIIVIHDDIDLPLGQIRLSKNSGDGGHNGIKSIIKQLGSKDFTRLKIGISTELSKKSIATEKFVLGKFSPEEDVLLEKIITSATECLQYYFENKLEKTMNKFNQKNN
jgi:peptidyl-tRNA hydrolase, PTH1 family